ncbi:polysaccharide pyruvyl transferase family protein [bacterium]|nr:polysaccharide pyruvyl transferase family protein [bacterium]
MNSYYVILTGSKNNAGDYLIKHRAIKLFEAVRSDRKIIDFNAWEPIDEKKLEVINQSKCLILMGGPALQKNMYPDIYKLPANLDKIIVPITTMGIGWKSPCCNWKDTYKHLLSDTTLRLLDRIKSDGLKCSVRDFHTLNALAFKGFDNFLMTGCPAYYDLDSIKKEFLFPAEINKVAFSLGVSFINSSSMEELIKTQILSLRERFDNNVFEVVFHHSLDKDKYMQAHGATLKHNKRNNYFADWLTKMDIGFVDVSGCAENLINYYANVDLHVGYRVHAHIFMNSIKRLSLLISEDGRAKGSQSAINGMVVDGYHDVKQHLIIKVLNKLRFSVDEYFSNKCSNEEIHGMLNYELNSGGHRSKQADALIKVNFNIMQEYLNGLP